MLNLYYSSKFVCKVYKIILNEGRVTQYVLNGELGMMMFQLHLYSTYVINSKVLFSRFFTFLGSSRFFVYACNIGCNYLSRLIKSRHCSIDFRMVPTLCTYLLRLLSSWEFPKWEYRIKNTKIPVGRGRDKMNKLVRCLLNSLLKGVSGAPLLCSDDFDLIVDCRVPDGYIWGLLQENQYR